VTQYLGFIALFFILASNISQIQKILGHAATEKFISPERKYMAMGHLYQNS